MGGQGLGFLDGGESRHVSHGENRDWVGDC